jgi:hypothetical protein
MIQQIALISETPDVPLAALAPVAAAIQKQVTRDVGPLWGIQATVDCFDRVQSMPGGYWPIIVRSDLPAAGANGIHEDKNKQPFALVRAMKGWELSASHEAIEMLIDPFGLKTVAGPSPLAGQGRVNFLVEICDPCQTARYPVNDIWLSDFCTPNYYDPIASTAVRYSFTGAVPAPRQVLKGGYLTWLDPATDHWFRTSFFGPKPRIIDLGPLAETPLMNFRSFIYSKTPEAFAARFKVSKRSGQRIDLASENRESASESRAAALQMRIDEILAQNRPPRRSTRKIVRKKW